ncbi:MAG: hypothetical protein HY816_08640 [Candidatus Wallbacteria bacterium]|nr:hypothetical protein [Candidatus Wallbacteria bacterium]
MKDQLTRCRRSAGYSLIEIALGVLIFSLVSGITMTIYSRSNTYAAKGTWRVQTTAKQRTALRQVKDFLEKSSYPSVIRVNNYYESSPDFGSEDFVMKLGSGTALKGTSAAVSYYSFETAGPVLEFFACTPRQELEGLASALKEVPGTARKLVLSLEATASTSSRMRLIATSSSAEVTLNGEKVQVGTLGTETPIVLLEDVTAVVVGVSTQAATREKTVLELQVVNSDPFDGRLKLREIAKATINVRVKK